MRAWQQHARYFDSIFGREDTNTLSKVRAFAKEHLTEKHDTMLYMFSGPDFLYATSFFPNASTYVLSRTRACRRHSAAHQPEPSAGRADAAELEASLGSILNYSFFITKNMKTQLNEGPVYGTLPVLLRFWPGPARPSTTSATCTWTSEGKIQRRRQEVAEIQRRRSAPTASRSCSPDGNRPEPDAVLFQHQPGRRQHRPQRLPRLLRQPRTSR